MFDIIEKRRRLSFHSKLIHGLLKIPTFLELNLNFEIECYFQKFFLVWPQGTFRIHLTLNLTWWKNSRIKILKFDWPPDDLWWPWHYFFGTLTLKAWFCYTIYQISMKFEIWPQMTPNFKFDPKPKFFFFKLYLDLTDNFELKFMTVGRICDF